MTYPETLGPLLLVSSHAAAMAYGELTADFNPIHCDPDFAAKSPFGRAICHGTMGLNLAIEAAERTLAPAYAVRDVKIRFSRPAPVGETLTAGATLTDASGAFRMDMPQIVPAFGQPHAHLAYDADHDPNGFRTVFLRPVMSSRSDTSLSADFVLQPA